MVWVIAILLALTGPASISKQLGSVDRLDRTLAWAISEYAAAGIEVPSVSVRLDNGRCHGSMRAFYDAETIFACRSDLDLRRTMIHELAHHLDAMYLTDDDRAAMLAEWGLETWGSHDVPWVERGAEVFADAVEWMIHGGWSRSGLSEDGRRAAFDVLMARTMTL